MDGQTKEIIASKRQLTFYKEFYRQYGYEQIEERRNPHHFSYTLVLKRKKPLLDMQNENLRRAEEKLRIIEIIDQKKRRFFTLFFNLFVHAAVFCLQAVLFVWLKLYQAHPTEMLRAGVVVLQLVLVAALVFKLWEILKWNATQNRLKKELLSGKTGSTVSGEKKEEYYVSALFTRGSGMTSTVIYWLTGRQYTHASIGLGEQTECFYSFDFRGFRTEHPVHRRLKNGRKESLCYQFLISKEEYEELKNVIDGYLREKEKYHYSFIGAVFCVLHIYLPVKQGRHYFCSEFVAEQLRKMKSMNLKKVPGMYLPGGLAKALASQKNLYRVFVNEI